MTVIVLMDCIVLKEISVNRSRDVLILSLLLITVSARKIIVRMNNAVLNTRAKVHKDARI